MASRRPRTAPNVLYYGDNIDILRERIGPASVDLIYLDPPFNSNRSYNVLFGRQHGGAGAQAQIHAFEDTWTWTPETEQLYVELIQGGAPNRVADTLRALHAMVGENDVLAYLVMMAPRLVALHRVLKPTGLLWLHCDPTASHYLKVLMDAVFDPRNFRNEVIWQRTLAKSLMTTRLPSNHDVLLVYGKSDAADWNLDEAFQQYDEAALDEKTAGKYRHRDPDGRLYRLDSLINPNRDRPNLTYEFLGVRRVWRWTKERMQQAYEEGLVVQTKPGTVPQLKRYLDEQRGRPFSDVWTDIPPINSRAKERLGYPTQKPQALLERIIRLSAPKDAVVLDPFCGCGTSVAAAQALGRRWIGIDITYLAIDLIRRRLEDHFPGSVTFDIDGIPRDPAGAAALFNENPLDFERWAVSLVYGQPNERQVGDRGIDGVVRFPLGKTDIGRVLISVKGGRQVNPAFVRDLKGTVETEGAEMGVLILQEKPTRGMIDAVNRAGTYTWPITGMTYPKLQIVTVDELLDEKNPRMPPAISPYTAAARNIPEMDQLAFGNGGN